MTTRGQSLYDRWARYTTPYQLVDRATRGLRREALETVDIDSVNTVLDVGCGPGSNFPLILDTLDPTGRLIGLDYSKQMTQRASNRTDDPRTTVLHGDATALPLMTSSVDVVVATLAFSAMPALDDALAEVKRVLDPRGTLVVVDGQPVTTPLQAIYERFVNFQNHDIEAHLNAHFDTVTVVRTFDAGLGVILTASP